MTVDEFHAFVEARPEDDRKWELIDGEAIVNASPALVHQIIVANVLIELDRQGTAQKASWVAVPCTAVVAPTDPYNAPVPDVLVAPGTDPDSWKTLDGLAVFEVISPSTRAMDLRRKPAIYARSETIGDYVVIDRRRRRVVHHARSAGWEPRTVGEAGAVLRLDLPGVILPLASIYRRTPLDPARRD